MKERSRMYYWPGLIKGWSIILLIIALTACQGQSIPDALIGTWVSDNPKYEHCFLKITPLRIIFGDPNMNSKEYDIKKVTTATKNQVVRVTINYVNTQKDPLSVDLLYSSEGSNGYILFKNQPDVIWKHQK